MTPAPRPVVTVVGLGPAGPELVGEPARDRLAGAARAFLRTGRHPAATAFPDAATFDHHYEEAETFDDVYAAIVDDLVAAAETAGGGDVVYAVPGSPLVAERTVELLRADPRVSVRIEPALSFLDLAWARLGIDPVASGVRLVDGARFAAEAAGERGPLLVAQCWSSEVLSDIKLAVDEGEVDRPGDALEATLLHHLGLVDERIETVRWDDLDRTLAPDHLTTLWIPRLAAPIGRRLAELVELVRTLRERCPWDREQTHASLAGHALEEAYEVVDAIAEVARFDDDPHADPGDEAPAVAHLEEELGDLLFQVVFHARLATEAGRFTLADVAGAVHDKLVARHPHVFGDVNATTPAAVLANWEVLKVAERGRGGITDGIPSALPALSLVGKLERKATAVGVAPPSFDDLRRALEAELGALRPPRDGAATGAGTAERLGTVLFCVAQLCGRLGVDPEEVLRRRALRLRDEIERHARDAAPFPESRGTTE
ncbi:MAG TPA: MazG family protein [Acidimicrobiales bacterium]|nr:MazG family protein [Acidimicrobiales bacterium]